MALTFETDLYEV